MSEEQLEYDPEWTLATLNDAKEALEDLIAQVEDSPEEVKEILEENIANGQCLIHNQDFRVHIDG